MAGRLRNFWHHVKDNKAMYLSAAVTVAAAGLMFKSCPEGIAKNDVPAPVCGNYICEENESNQYQRDPKTHVELKDAAGNKTPNKYYCKLDCFKNDGRYDDGKDKTQVQAQDGTQLKDFPDKYLDGTPVKFPLEDQTSVDYIMKLAKDQPCSPVDPKNPVYLSRTKITPDLSAPEKLKGLQIELTPQQVEKRSQHPESIVPGDNFFTAIFLRNEVCDDTKPQCDEFSYFTCNCPNLLECKPLPPPPEKTCGNGVIDTKLGEQCDPKSRQKNKGCDDGYTCKKCLCVKKTPPPPPPPTCGNKVVDPGEDCDNTGQPRGGCSEGQKCESCKCVEDTPISVGPCESSTGIEALKQNLRDAVDAKADAFRKAYQASTSAKVVVTITVPVSADGLVGNASVSSTCSGSSDDCQVQNVNASAVLGTLDAVGDTVSPPPRIGCNATVRRGAGN